MQQPKMIVLGLIAQGMKYGLEMQKHIDETNMRLWAHIGGSTIYKALRDLEADGCVTAQLQTAQRGPGKTVYNLTVKGKDKLNELVGEALSSHAFVYSDRVAGLVLSVSLPRAKARREITKSLEIVDSALNLIKQTRDSRSSPLAQIVLDYYRDIYRAEGRALKAVHEQLATTHKHRE